MKFFRLDLLTLLISLFILNSCKNQDSIGLGVVTPGQVNGNLVDTSTIIINTVPEDSVITSIDPTTQLPLAKNPLGLFYRPYFWDYNIKYSHRFEFTGISLLFAAKRHHNH